MAINNFTPTGLREALLAPLLRTTLQLALKPAFSPRWSIPAQRRWLTGVSRLTLPPRGVVIEATTVGGVPGEWVRPRDGTPRRGTVLYLHGGAYCVGSPATHRPITGALARATGMAVLVLDYRLRLSTRIPPPCTMPWPPAGRCGLLAPVLARWCWRVIRPAPVWPWPPAWPCAPRARRCPRRFT